MDVIFNYFGEHSKGLYGKSARALGKDWFYASAIKVQGHLKIISASERITKPRRIVLGTIAVAAGEALCFAPLRSRVAARLWPQQADRLEIVPAALGRALPERAGLAVALGGMPGALD